MWTCTRLLINCLKDSIGNIATRNKGAAARRERLIFWRRHALLPFRSEIFSPQIFATAFSENQLHLPQSKTVLHNTNWFPHASHARCSSSGGQPSKQCVIYPMEAWGKNKKGFVYKLHFMWKSTWAELKNQNMLLILLKIRGRANGCSKNRAITRLIFKEMSMRVKN